MKRLTLFVITLILGLGSSRAFSYVLTSDFMDGFYWRTFPVKIAIAESDSEERDRLEGLLNYSIKLWESEVGHDIWEFANSGTTANVIRWSDNFAAETGFDPATTLGVTIRYNKGTYYERVEIVLNRGASHLVANEGNLLFQTILHEIGHTVGLGHTEDHGIMIPFIGSVNELSLDDIEGMRAVIDETLWRQDTGFVSDHATTSTQTGGCAPVGSSDPAKTGTNDGLSFAISLLLGILGVLGVRKLFPLAR